MNKVIMMLVLIAFSKTMAQQPIFKDKFDDAIPVLNFGTFHMGFTSDANSVDFDENDRKNQEDVKKVAKMLAEFKPTVIIVETPPSFNEALQKEYSEYQYKFLIVTDSEFWINVITKWSNNWIKKKLYMDKKNLDIILYINYYLYLLNTNNILIDFKFIRGHADKNKNEELDIYQKGNIIADKLANIGKESLDLNIKLI
jgi:hypothetical protein